MKRLLVALTVLLGLAIAADGGQLYSQNCAGCHGPTAAGIPGTFPPLAGNPNVQNEAHVLTVIKQGLTGALEVNGQKYNGVMPPMAQVSDADAGAIAAYLKGLGGSQTAQTPVATPQADAGLAPQGKAFFEGSQRFANGGSPCIACHTVGNSLMGGGNLGKDKTDVYTRLGAAGIQGVLSNISFPVMREAFKNKALTSDEIAALTAYFAQVAKEKVHPAWRDSGRLFYAGALGALVLFVVMGMFWSNRREGLAERIRRTRRQA